MQVLKTIPAIPAVAEIIDSVYNVSTMQINFLQQTVTFIVTSSYISPLALQNQPPLSRTVSFAEIGALLTAPVIDGFVLTVRTALALSMGVSIDKVPPNIFQ
jgi:hypothetical protein